MAEQRIQRRLAAVMAADMVGYSRMTSTDEARTLVRLRLLREEVFVPEIRAHGGRLVKEMGDGLLAEFNSTVDALECAVAVQRAIEGHERAAEQEDPIRYRVGINLGDIVIEGDDILGDGVNIAARLESLAEPGGIVVSSAVFDQVRGKLDFAYEHLGERNLKNISEPVRIYRVFPSGRPDTLELSVRERQFRESVRDRFADDVAYYVPLLGRTTEAGTEKKTRALRSVCRRKRRAEFEYHEWIAVGEDVKQVKIDSLSDAVEKYPGVVLLGEPGCGKTTALEALAYEYSQRSDRLPLLLRLSEFTGDASAEDFVAHGWGGAPEAGHWGASELASNLKCYLEAGKLLILFDGLNELPTESLKNHCVKLRNFIERWSNRGNRFVVTCRVLDYGEELASLQRIELQALNEDQIRRFLRNELPERWQALWDILVSDDGSHRLLEMGRNPYLLTVMIDVFEQDGNLAENRAELMHRFSQILLDWAKAKTAPDQWLDTRLLIEALSIMAFEMQRRSGFGTKVQTDLIRAVMPQSMRSDPNWPRRATPPDQVLNLAANANILEIPVDRRTVRFYHQLLQEYFASRRMRKENPAELADLWRGPWLESEMPVWERPDNNFDPLPPPPATGWEETTLLAHELSADNDNQLVLALLEINPVLAGRCLLQNGARGDSSIRKAVVDRLLAAIADPQVALRVRIAAGKLLGELGDPRLGEMITISGGTFVMGDGRERHRLFVPEYRITKFPLTNWEYRQFIDSGGYGNKRWWTEAGWIEVGQHQEAPRFWRDPRFNAPNQPVIGLSWYECVAFCKWLSANIGQLVRLPTEAEWERGARGEGGSVYPWGDDPDATRLNGRGPRHRQVCATTPVGIYPTGVSPHGLYDCVGNAWEWCATRWKKPFPYDIGQDEWASDYLQGQSLRVLRGGAWYNKWDSTSCTHRFRFQPYGWNDRGGCRLVSAG